MEQSSNIAPRAAIIVVITALLVWAYTSMGIKFGQDLKGGTTLRFALDIDGAKENGLVDNDIPNEKIVEDTLKIISERIDKYGLAEIQLTQYGENKFLVSLPADAGTQPDAIEKIISQLGDLKFRMEVLPDSKYGRGEDNPAPARTGLWNGTEKEFNDWKNAEIARWRAARDAGELASFTSTKDEYLLVKKAKVRGQGNESIVPDGSEEWHFAVIEATSGPVNFDGGILTNPSVSEDYNTGKPVVVYEVKNEFQNDFGKWTGTNVGLPMAIILNNEYHSAPIINERLTKSVQISLGYGSNKSLREEAKALATVLQTGSLKIQPVLEAKNVMGPSLAGESRDRGVQAILVAFMLVLVFMVIFYRTSGMIANVALLLNLVLLVGFMSFFQAVLTLPGIAGIVLTVGMAVDANILINERIREERRGGRSMARAVAEGYDRALSAIVDANVTSLITAIFLYNFGSGPVRGFAVTLAIGLIVSMFTAIFVTRTIMDWLMKVGIVKDVKQIGEPPKIQWLALRRIFAPISVLGIVFGLVMFFSTDKYTLYGIDFTGGYRMQADFTEKTTPDEVRDLLAKSTMDVDVELSRFDEATGDRVTRKQTIKVGPYPNAQVLSAGKAGRSVEISVQRLFQDTSKDQEAQSLAYREYVRRILADRLMPDWQVERIKRYVHVAKEGDAGDDPKAALNDGISGVIAFKDPDALLSAEKLQSILTTDMPFWTQEDGRERAFKPSERGLTRTVIVEAAPSTGGVAAYAFWLKSATAGGTNPEANPSAMAQRMGEYLGGKGLKDRLKQDMDPKDFGKLEDFGLSQPFPSEDAIGSSVAEGLRDDAMVALFLSLVFIIIYIALRFQSRAMGFAAVLCLFHDVAITLGLVAVANSLGIVDAKLNLAMVAAFLTLVGYSVNDTVVVFDRIRENRGKRPTIDEDLINNSINQTLARTIRTTATFLLVCFALFGFNYGQRNVLEGFSFLLILGSLIGTYSTIAISTPLLLFLPWLWERIGHLAPKGSLVTACMSNAATILFTPVAALAWVLWWVVFGLVAFVAGLVMFVPWALSGGEERAAAATTPA